ncbi:MAG: phage terminase large subunit [Candidatus Methanoperedens sp.]
MNLSGIGEVEDYQEAIRLIGFLKLTVTDNPYIPIEPTSKQMEFLALNELEALYGGACGGGKSIAILAAALQGVIYPDYAAILFRRSYTDLTLPGALMDVAHDWLNGTDAHWNELTKTWTFPSGATLTFGYLQFEKDKYRYQGSAYHFVGFDELSQFSETMYTYLFSRLRKTEASDLPLRMRATSNPGGEGHQFVLNRFILGKEPNRIFIPANLDDNPYLNKPRYLESLAELDYVTREQLLNGDWFISPSGGIFKREWFRWYSPSELPKDLTKMISCDLAFKDVKTADYTVYQLWGQSGANYYLLDQVRGQWDFPTAKAKFRKFCDDNKDCHLKIIEDKAAGISLIQELKRDIGGLVPYNPGSKSKPERASTISPYVESGNVYLPSDRRDAWVNEFLDECVAFPTGRYDDQVDAMSQALIKMRARNRQFLVGSIR